MLRLDAATKADKRWKELEQRRVHGRGGLLRCIGLQDKGPGARARKHQCVACNCSTRELFRRAPFAPGCQKCGNEVLYNCVRRRCRLGDCHSSYMTAIPV